MRVFGLIGKPLTHSFSQSYFLEKFRNEQILDATYEMFELNNPGLLQNLIIQNKYLVGVNVTIPYKQSIIEYIDELDPLAKKIMAVNCIKIIRQSGKILTRGYNTDALGFKHTITPLLQPHHKKAILLGSGGSSRAITYVLDSLGIEFVVVSRNPQSAKQIGYSDITEKLLQTHSLVINTTPLGMYPKTNDYPLLPYACLSDKHLLYDLIYNPAETKFLELGKKSKAVVHNGLQMLSLQAEFSWKIWNNKFE